jgi:hypothetical protein
MRSGARERTYSWSVDTSIAIAIVAAALFVFIVPSVLRRGAEVAEPDLAEDERARAQPVEAPRVPGCAVDPSRPVLLADRAHPADVGLPEAGAEYVQTAPRLRLRRAHPVLEVVGETDQPAPADRTDHTVRAGVAEAAAETVRPVAAANPYREATPFPEAEVVALPMAVGETTVLTEAGSGSAPGSSSAAPQAPVLTVVASTRSQPMDPAMNHTPRTAPRRIAAAAERMPRALPADVRARLDQSYASSPRRSGGTAPQGAGGAGTSGGAAGPAAGRTGQAPRPGRIAEVSAADRRRIRGLRRILPYCGLGFLLLAAATVVMLGFTVFGSLPWGAPAVTAALAAATLVLLRSLNREITALRKGIEREEKLLADRARGAATEVAGRAREAAGRAARHVSERSAAGRKPQSREVLDLDEGAPRQAQAAADRSAPGSDESDPITAEIPAVSAAPRHRAAEQAAPVREPARSIVERSASAPSLSLGFTASSGEKAGGTASGSAEAPAEGVSASARTAATEPASGDSAEGASARADRSAAGAPGPETESGETADGAAAASGADAVSTRKAGAESAGTAAAEREAGAQDTTGRTAAAADASEDDAAAPAPAVPDTASLPRSSAAGDALARRLRSGGWTPSAVPAPTYVDAPVAERQEPQPVVADASSYALAPTSRESLAAQFADELGFRPPLEDAAREGDAADPGPLSHGKNATRRKSAGGAPAAPADEQDTAHLGDILARRRA